jgi:hypothetical protein
MSLFIPRSWLLVAALLLGGATNAHAQMGQSPVAPEVFAPGHWTPFAPVDTDVDYQWFAPPNLSEYGCDRPELNEGFFFQYDRLIWAFTRPKNVDIGNEAVQRTVTIPTGRDVPIGARPTGGIINYVNGLETEFIETEFVWGNRFELGYVVDDQGWLVSAFHVHTLDRLVQTTGVDVAFFDPLGVTFGFLDLNGDGIDDDLNTNNVYGRSGADINPFDGVPETPAFPDFGDQALSPVRFTNFLAQNQTAMHGVELMKIWRLPRMHYGGSWEWYLGARYIGLSDEFTINAQGGLLADFNLFSEVNNFVVGPQIGARWARTRGRWTVSAEGRFVAAANFQQVRLRGNYATLAPVGGDATGAFPNVTPTRFDDKQTDEEFAPVGELRFETQFHIASNLSLRMGYNGMVIGGTSRASRRINYDLPQLSILDGRKNEAFIVNGFNFGFELNR